MSINHCSLLFILFIGLTSLTASAQKPPMKFGKINEQNFRNEGCPIDSSAHAHYIFDFGYSYFEYADTRVASNDIQRNRKGFQLLFNRHFRIKINDNNGFEWANIRIPLYYDKDQEKILKLKASTYNYENGRIVQSKVSNSDVAYEDTRENWKTAKFAMPNVKKGSIIEVEYVILSDYYFNLQEWYFQRSIPVLQSDYYVEIPEYFHYNETQKGYFPIERQESSQARQIEIIYVEKAEAGYVYSNGNVGGQESYSQKINYIEVGYHYSAHDVTAFPAEAFLRTDENYLAKMEFELNSTQFPQQTTQSFSVSWEVVDETLLESEAFGKQLTKDNHLKEVAQAILQQSNDSTPAQILMKKAFLKIQKQLVWNGIQNKYVETSLKKAYDEGAGNCAEINLNLVALLRMLGIHSNPLALSTQEHGIIHPVHPSLSRFNYVIAMAEINGETYLLDATDPYSDINLLPIRCLNDKGRVIGGGKEPWINLMDYKSYKSYSKYQMVLTDALDLTGKGITTLKDYGAYLEKKDLKKANDPDQFAKEMEKEFPGVEIKNVQVEGLDSLSDRMRIDFDFADTEAVNSNGDMIYFSPCFAPFFKENPFKLDERQYPVEFNFPYSISQSYEITIPDSYEISEIPKQKVVKLPNNSGMFSYQLSQKDHVINVTSTILIGKSLFLPSDYDYIKQFFQLIMDSQNELVVLKKI